MKNFLKIAFNQNQWLWFHMLAGGFFTYLLLAFGMSQFETFVIIAVCGFVWEILEFLHERFYKGFQVYGGKIENFIADAFGDFVGEIVMSIIVILAFGLR